MFLIYHKETTILHKELISGRDWWPKYFHTERGAKCALTRLVNAGKYKREDWAIAERVDFYANIEKTVTKRNFMSGREFTQPVNVHRCCDPSTEAYWSM